MIGFMVALFLSKLDNWTNLGMTVPAVMESLMSGACEAFMEPMVILYFSYGF